LLEEVGEHRVGVKRHVPEHVVKDVGLRQVVELFAGPYRKRRGEPPLGQTLEELMGWDKARDTYRCPTGACRQAGIDVVEVRHAIGPETDLAHPFEENRAARLGERRRAPLVQDAPHIVIIFVVALIALRDEYRELGDRGRRGVHGCLAREEIKTARGVPRAADGVG
jgi:hypothetical protein